METKIIYIVTTTTRCCKILLLAISLHKHCSFTCSYRGLKYTGWNLCFLFLDKNKHLPIHPFIDLFIIICSLICLLTMHLCIDSVFLLFIIPFIYLLTTYLCISSWFSLIYSLTNPFIFWSWFMYQFITWLFHLFTDPDIFLLIFHFCINSFIHYFL